MKHNWSIVPLGDVMVRCKDAITVQDTETYRRLTIRMNGAGIVLRDSPLGVEIGTKTQFLVKEGQLLLSKIDARNGAFGIVPQDCDGAIITGNFWAFDVDASRFEPKFFNFLTKTRLFIDFCIRASEGTTNRLYLQEPIFLQQKISLPPLTEQRRIIARIEAVAAHLAEARGLRREAIEEADNFYENARDQVYRAIVGERQTIEQLFDLINGRAFKPTDWTEIGRKIVRIQNLKYPNAPYNHYDGNVEDKFLLQRGDVLFAWSGQVVSLGAHIWNSDEEAILNQHIFNVKPRQPMLPRFVQEGFNTLINEMKEQVRGLEMFHIRKQELNKLMFPILPLPEQKAVVGYLDGLRIQASLLKRLQAEASAELDALLPAVLDKAFKGEL